MQARVVVVVPVVLQIRANDPPSSGHLKAGTAAPAEGAMSEFERIRRACVKRGELWEDPDFPATQSSVFYHQTPPFQFVWKRPH
ncbi:hypothetical protein B566_EDAN006928, partial [Ephemera danica]